MENFKDNLRNLRKRRHLLQKDVAEYLKVQPITYGAWERGFNEPSLQMLCNIASFFEVSVDYLLGREEEDGRIVIQERELPFDERQLLNYYKRMPESYRIATLEYMKSLGNLLSNNPPKND